MLEVQSLKRVVATQFAAILVPLMALIAFHVASNASRTAELDRLMRAGHAAAQARDHYATFANGAADAVDRGRLSRVALVALARAHEAVLAIEDRTRELNEAVITLAEIERALADDAGLPTLVKLREQIGAAHHAVAAEERRQEALLQAAMERSIAASQRETRVTVVLSLGLLALTLWFIRRLVRELSKPLAFAVSVAERIARREPVADTEFERRRDIGNLVQSLGSMNRQLRIAQAEVQAQQRGLEVKVRELSDSRASLDEAQRLAQTGNWIWEVGAAEAQWSDQMYRVVGLARGQVVPRLSSLLALLPAPEASRLLDQVHELQRAAGRHVAELTLPRPDGQRRVLYMEVRSQAGADGRVQRMHGIVQDVTARREAEAEIRRLALYDGLTGLPNRARFRENLDKAIARARRTGSVLATLFIDLDRFKRINDTLGHGVGDRLLEEAARRLQRSVREGDELAREGDSSEEAIARLGGDEFTVTLAHLRHPQDAARVAQRIVDELAQPISIDGNELVVTASVGIAVFPSDGDSAEVLLKNADAAMVRAKELGKNTCQFYADDLNSSAVAKLSLENELRRALERDQFVLHYQPKVDVRSGHIVGVEALIRWQHPEWGLMAPGRFIGLAEEMGLIAHIGDWVLEAACAQLASWRAAGLPAVTMAINLASPSFRQAELVPRVGAALRAYRIEPRQLQLEATESILMSDADATLHTLRQLRELGVALAIDDFGTGYSSLSYLRRFPIDQLKIDRSFVQDMTVNRDDAAIASAIVSLGRSLKLELVAEGVETLAQARALRALGCAVMQGFYFSRPVPASEIAQLLRARVDFAGAVQQRMDGYTAPMPLLPA